MRRVVVTGMGAITPLGNNVNDFWNGIKNENVGIDKITKFDTENLDHIGCDEVCLKPDPSKYNG